VVGWLLIGMSAVLAVLFNPLGELGGQVYFLGGLSTSPSEIIEVRRLPFTEGGRARFAVDAINYQFQAPDGRVYGGVSYASAGDLATGPTRGTVEYRASLPGISRLGGHRMSPGGMAGLVMLAPGLVGVLLLRGGRRGG
jgi:hypothetical protein